MTPSLPQVSAGTRRPSGGGTLRPQLNGVDFTPLTLTLTLSNRGGLRTLPKNPRGVDVRFRSRSGGVAAQHVTSLLSVVALSD